MLLQHFSHSLCLEFEFEEPIHFGILRHRDSVDVILKSQTPHQTEHLEAFHLQNGRRTQP